MRFSQFFLPTLKEAPAEAEVISQKLMFRAGMIRRLAQGIYTVLPYGLRAIRKFENIVREEMNRSGGCELLMPAIQPREIWDQSGRWAIYGKELLRIKDRHDREFCFGPTHEEVITHTIGNEIRSYRDMPLNFYQIQSKFRDEVRPRFGLMRGREFIMKDAYSFDVSKSAAEKNYWLMYDTYKRIFTRCGLKFRPVEAMTGNIGGSLSHEFQVLAESGESLIASCNQCDYAANIEKAQGKAKPSLASVVGRAKTHTPGLRSVAEVTSFLQCDLRQMLKTLVYWTPKGLVAACVRGDFDVSEAKLQAFLDAEDLRLATDAETEAATGVAVGFLGPKGLPGVKQVVLDTALNAELSYWAGANVVDYHAPICPGSDVCGAASAEIRQVLPGDGCPKCEGSLSFSRGIEVGQVFYLGTKYSKAMGATFLDEKGEQQVIEMGCYGIGIGRTIAAAIEQNHDDKGIIFPLGLAPFSVLLIALYGKTSQVAETAEKIYADLQGQGVDVLLDDRDARPGFKFNDADLIGIPWHVVIGEKSLLEGKVEVKCRATGLVEKVLLPQLGVYLKEKMER